MAEVFRRKVPVGLGADGGFPQGGRVDPFGGMTTVLQEAEGASPAERRNLLRVGKPDVIGVRNAILVDEDKNGKVLGIEILDVSKNINAFDPSKTSAQIS